MKREIKFRGKRVDNGEWTYGDLTHSESIKNGEISTHTLIGTDYSFDAVIPEIIGQFTGLTDKNGKEIYEGDVVSVPYITPFGALTEDEDCKSVVEFKDASFQIKTFNRITYDLLSYWCERSEARYVSNVGNVYDLLQTTKLKIIGNIHDNPELINQTIK